MYKCPKCWRATIEKVDICPRCRTNISNYDTKILDKLNNEEKFNNQSETDRLNDLIDNLRKKGKQAVASRDNWKMRAEAAEKKLKETVQSNDKKFKQVKMIFSKMYHPDSLTGEKYEKLIKQEVFKEFWQEIINIEKNNT